MIAIYGYNGEDYELLDAPDTAVELSFQIASLRRPNAKVAPFSLTFSMPFSLTNNKFFGHQQEASLQTTDFDLSRKTSARLYDNNVPIMQGIIQVTSIDISAKAYKCRFFSETADLFDSIKGRSWADVWRDDAGNVNCPLDHVLSDSVAVNSWSGISPAGPAYTIIYALTDVGLPLVEGWDYPAYYYGYWDDTGVKVQGLRPCVRISYLLDQVLDSAGYVRDTSVCFFSDTMYNSTNLYMMTGLGAQQLPTRLAYGFFVQGLDSQNHNLNCGTENAYGSAAALYFDSAPTTPFYDPDSQVSPVGWIPQVDQTATLEFTFQTTGYTGTAGDPLPNCLVTLTQGAVGIATFEFEYEDALDAPITWSPTVSVTAANGLCLVFFQCTGASITRQLDVDVTMALVGYDVAAGDNATTIQMVDALGKTTVDKWLQGLCDTYNLVINVEERTKKVSFQLYDDWIESGGTPIDWTDKVDADGPMELLPSTEYVPRQLYLTPAEGTDHKNAYYAKRFGVRKGAFRYQSRNDFATEDQTIGDVFTLLRSTYLKGLWQNNGTVNTNVPTTSIIISELWSSFDGTKVEYDAMPNALCYYHGDQDLTDFPIQLNGTQTSAPLFTSYSGDAADPGVFSLEYALTAPDLVDNSVLGVAVNGLYDKFWYNYLQGLFSRDARVLKCQARLTALDIHNLDFSRYVHVKNVQYRVISIDNYVVGGDGLCNLTLFKRADGFLFDCGLTPTVGTDGRVTWVDGDGTPATATELCCVSYGYTWNAGNATCTVHSNREVPITTGDNAEDVPGGSVNRSNGYQLSNTGNPIRKFMGDLTSPITTEEWPMSVTSRDNITVDAVTEIGQSVFQVSPDRIVTIRVEWLAVETSGGNKGKSSSGLEEVLLSTVSSSTSKTDGSVYSRGLSGFTVTVNVTDGDGGSNFTIQCQGPVGGEYDWFIEVRTVMYETSRFKALTDGDIALFQDGDNILFQNDDIMLFNAS